MEWTQVSGRFCDARRSLRGTRSRGQRKQHEQSITRTCAGCFLLANLCWLFSPGLVENGYCRHGYVEIELGAVVSIGNMTIYQEALLVVCSSSERLDC